MAQPDCLYHNDQNGFVTIQKELVRCHWLPRKHAHRLAMAVCSCRKTLAPIASQDELIDYFTTVHEMMDNADQIPSNVSSFIEECMNKCNGSNFSCCQLISILGKARHGDFSMLSRASLSTNSKISEKDLQKQINRKKKLTKKQIDLIIKKKKKRHPLHLLNLPTFPGNLPQLMKCDFVSNQKLCIIEPHYAKNNEHFDNNKNETVLKVWGNPENIKTLSFRMIEEAKKVQQKVDYERERRKRMKEEKRSYLEADWSCNYEDEWNSWPTEDLKTTLVDDFSLKAHKSARGKKKSQVVKVQTSVLDGGHCLQCYKPFTNLHDSSSCTFHAGFTVFDPMSNRKKWSCCDTEVRDDLNNFQLHSNNGCTTSRVHNWRTHAKGKGKDTQHDLSQKI